MTGWRRRIKRAVERSAALLKLGPSAGEGRVAMRVALSAMLPIIGVEALGHPQWCSYALLTSTVAVYGRGRAPQARLRIQGQVGVLQVLLIVGASVLGTASPSPAALVACIACVAAAGTALADIRRWTPPGALFFVMVFAIPATRLGADARDGLVALSISAVSLAIVLTVTVLDGRFPSPADTQKSISPGPRGRVIAAHAFACLGGSLAAGMASVALGFHRPYWAMISAIVPMMGESTRAQLKRATQRLVGTLAGLGPAALLFEIRLSTPILLTVQVALMACTEMLVARNYAVAMLFLTPMSIGMALIQPRVSLPMLLKERALETAMGVAAGAIAAILTHRIRHPRAAEAEAREHR